MAANGHDGRVVTGNGRQIGREPDAVGVAARSGVPHLWYRPDMDETDTTPFGRVLTAIITPFTEEGAVDYATFWKLVRHLGANGSDGIVVVGTTGESPTTTRAEKVALFKAAVDAAKGSMTVVAGVGTYDTRESVELASAAAASGVDGLMAVTPYYSKPPQRGIVKHMTQIADATDRPLLIYNIRVGRPH